MCVSAFLRGSFWNLMSFISLKWKPTKNLWIWRYCRVIYTCNCIIQSLEPLVGLPWTEQLLPSSFQEKRHPKYDHLTRSTANSMFKIWCPRCCFSINSMQTFDSLHHPRSSFCPLLNTLSPKLHANALTIDNGSISSSLIILNLYHHSTLDETVTYDLWSRVHIIFCWTWNRESPELSSL